MATHLIRMKGRKQIFLPRKDRGGMPVVSSTEQNDIEGREATPKRMNDLNTKNNAARKFIEKGNKVKVTLRFRGREMAHIDSSKHILEEFAEKLSDIAVVEKAPKLEGRSMMMFLTEKR